MKQYLLFLLFLPFLPFQTLAIDPAKLTITNFRAEAVQSASDEIYYKGDVLLFTNCICYSGTSTSSARQDLSSVTVTVTWTDGTLASTSVTGTVNTATAGVWSASCTIRTNEGVKTYFQIRLADTNSNTFTYPFKYLEIKAKL